MPCDAAERTRPADTGPVTARGPAEHRRPDGRGAGVGGVRPAARRGRGRGARARTRPTPSWPGPSWRCADVHEPLAAALRRTATTPRPSCSSAALRIALDAAAAQRPAPLRDRRDRRREVDRHWYQRAPVVGYVCYADRFAGTLADLPGPARLPGRAGRDLSAPDAVASGRGRGRTTAGTRCLDYRDVDPRVGTMADLVAVARALHERGMSLCVDLVLNHTAREHGWAQGWLAGDPDYANFYSPSPTGRCPTPTSAPSRGLPGPRARLVHLGARRVRRLRQLGLDDLLVPTSGTWTTATRPSPGDAGEITWLANRGVNIFGWTPSRSSGSGWARPA